MSPLHHGMFPDFFRAINGTDPFPWQRRLAERACAGSWPAALALPTASGKTACLDVALFALACQASLPPAARTAPRRIAFVVDRRVIVDEAFERARRIAYRLRAGLDWDGKPQAIIGEVAGALRRVAGTGPGEEPLVCAHLRGGIYHDPSWAAVPTQPTVIASTVDQVGSRLLFRGYGVSDSMKPVHAGLLGNDCLLFLDEAHCARPFAQTAAAVAAYREWKEANAPNLPFRLVVLSATPPADTTGEIFRLDEAQDLAPEALGPRVLGSKPAELFVEEVPGGVKGQEKFASKLVEHASRMVEDHGLRAIAIMVNRVNTAYKVHEQCRRRWPAHKAGAICMTGRMRPYDRDRIVREWAPRLRADKKRSRPETPLFVTATQCLEVGANFDFEGLVTECASLDALRQRFGRLRRLGVGPEARAAIVIRDDQVKTEDEISKEPAAKKDSVYGDALPRTWNRLWDRAATVPAEGGRDVRIIDFGVAALGRLVPTADEGVRLLEAPSRDAPVMLPSHIDCWSQTAPRPAPDPDAAIFLHGPEQGVGDVRVCWRADLTPDEEVGNWKETVSLCPPTAAECMPVPLPFIRAWLRNDSKAAAANDAAPDLEGGAHEPAPEEEPNADVPRRALRWRGPEDPATGLVDDPGSLQPGDTLVIPALDSGAAALAHFPDWNGASASGWGLDIAEPTARIARRRAVLRLTADRLDVWPDVPAREALREIALEEPYLDDARQQIREALGELAAHPGFPEETREIALALASDTQLKIHSPSNRAAPSVESGPKVDAAQSFGVIVLVGSKLLKPQSEETLGGELVSTEDDTASATVDIALDTHSEGVADLVGRYAQICGLGDELCLALTAAARLHDAGKADPRFQAWLRDGSARVARLAPKPLAKSDGLSQSWSQREAARARSGYPRGARHELVSVSLAKRLLAESDHRLDAELVLHLIGSHHGYCRPLAPVVDDAEPVEVEFADGGISCAVSSDTALHELGSGVAERYWLLVRRYGWWGLAWLEGLLRLADHRRSAIEQEGAGA